MSAIGETADTLSCKLLLALQSGDLLAAYTLSTQLLEVDPACPSALEYQGMIRQHAQALQDRPEEEASAGEEAEAESETSEEDASDSQDEWGCSAILARLQQFDESTDDTLPRLVAGLRTPGAGQGASAQGPS
eukprot:NODE_6492_length_530_cov_12.439206_g6327_i0.p1 GENE.NODE_6492_length_530_cov_12.439206_g6327_i0~~NODE_6492_length_530_cov_12.439206_g6327_i0.p1  ORF type:complete len:133 (+),score=35.42 NODE_6492_length_530_cov_12.439206_g6327_i0:74-472(+)